MYVELEAALTTWSDGHSQVPLSTPTSFSQKSWGAPVVKGVADHLQESASDERLRAQLLASTQYLLGIGCMAECSSSVTVHSSNG